MGESKIERVIGGWMKQEDKGTTERVPRLHYASQSACPLYCSGNFNLKCCDDRFSSLHCEHGTVSNRLSNSMCVWWVMDWEPSISAIATPYNREKEKGREKNSKKQFWRATKREREWVGDAEEGRRKKVMKVLAVMLRVRVMWSLQRRGMSVGKMPQRRTISMKVPPSLYLCEDWNVAGFPGFNSLHF